MAAKFFPFACICILILCFSDVSLCTFIQLYPFSLEYVNTVFNCPPVHLPISMYIHVSQCQTACYLTVGGFICAGISCVDGPYFFYQADDTLHFFAP